MIDITQFVLLSVVISLAVVLVVVGIQTIKILAELKLTITKVNKILDDSGTISESVAKPISAFSGFLLGVKGIRVFDGLATMIKNHKKSSLANKKAKEEGEDNV